MAQRLYLIPSVIEDLLSIPERQWNVLVRSACNRGVQRVADLAGISTHMNGVANQFKETAHRERDETEKERLFTEAARWSEMARKANLLAQRGVPSTKDGRDS